MKQCPVISLALGVALGLGLYGWARSRLDLPGRAGGLPAFGNAIGGTALPIVQANQALSVIDAEGTYGTANIMAQPSGAETT